MTRQVLIVEATRDRAAAGRTMVGTAGGMVFGAGLLIAHLGGGSFVAPAVPPPEIVRPQVTKVGNVQVIAVGQGTRHNRCDVRGFANGAAVTFEVDTGDPDIADFPGSYVAKLGITKPLAYAELWPGTRYGKTARTTLRQIRVGDVVWNDPEVNVYSDWNYSFGDDQIPLLGLAALRMRGINVEFEGGEHCRLTVARKGRAGS